jgi:DNA-binding NarL/FixJ family response regulator
MQPSFSELLEHITAAPFERSRWSEALTGLGQVAGGWGSQLIISSARRGYVVDLAPGVPQECIEELERWGVDTAAQPRMALQRAPFMQVLGDYDLIDERARQRNEFYAFARRWDASFCCLARIDQIDDLSVMVAALRAEATGHVEMAERVAFGAFLPHLRSAVRLQLRLEDQAASAGMGMMEAVGLPVVLCDRAGQVKAISATAEIVLSTGSAATVREGRLYCTNAEADAALRSAIDRAACTQSEVSSPKASRLYLHGRERGDDLVVSVTPVPRMLNDFRLGVAVLVVFDDQPPKATKETDELRRLYHLTKAEVDVAVALCSGLSVIDISAQRGVKISTLRSQVASLLAKTHASRQAELVALLVRLGTVGRDREGLRGRPRDS